MEFDRPHYRTTTPSTSSTTSGELFICLTSRLSSSSSMKLAKSILSPGRARDHPPISLSTSLSRRLRTNGSIKGGQASPMFPTGGKKRGCAFENPEPSSPKVTCIGQVRVKTKKKVKQQTRSLSRRRSGEVSFRKVEQLSHELKNNESNEGSECASTQQKYAPPGNSSSHLQQQECLPHRNQKWVHLPVSICEALRAFGAEFSCLFPCRSSCFSTNEREKEEKANGQGLDGEGGGNNGQSSCGAIFARWFVALQDCEGGKGREIELVVGGDEQRAEVRERTSMRSSRRHVFEDIEFKEETIEGKGEEGEEEEKARVSICIPPKNALLLMRCRSDPMKMAALANRFWESPAPKDEDQDEEDGEGEEENDEENKDLKVVVQDPEFVNEAGIDVEEGDEAVGHFVSAESKGEAENQEKDADLANEVQEFVQKDPEEKPNSIEELEESEGIQALAASQEPESDLHSSEGHLDQEMAENKTGNPIQEQGEQENEEESNQIDNSLSPSENSDKQDAQIETEEEVLESAEAEAALEEENREKTEESNLEEEIQEETSLENEDAQAKTLFISELERTENACEEEKIEQIEESHGQESQDIQENDEGKNEDEVKGEIETKEKDPNVLPDCLLLMMCEPKLSMEVSKETWVCSTDFIRWLPERPIKKKVNVNVSDEPKKEKEVSTDCLNLHGPQPPAQETMTQHKNQQQEVILPPRSSCSLPAAAAVSMAAMIEQKLVDAVGYEPFVLTRCKSEPMRTAAAKLMPEACFWKNRKLEPHRNATFGVGAAGVGF